jgi:hypothetical protein
LKLYYKSIYTPEITLAFEDDGPHHQK